MEPGLGLRAVGFQSQASSHHFLQCGRGPSCPPQWPSLPRFSSPSLLAFIRQETQVLCPLPITSPMLPPGLPDIWGIPGPSQFSPRTRAHPSKPKARDGHLSGSVSERGSAQPLPQEADLTYPMVMMTPGHRPPLGLCEFSDPLHGSHWPSSSFLPSLPA